MIQKTLGVAAGVAATALAAPGVALASHGDASVVLESTECGEATVTARWNTESGEGTGTDGTMLLVAYGDTVRTAPVGEPVTVTVNTDTEVRYGVLAEGEGASDSAGTTAPDALAPQVETNGYPGVVDTSGEGWQLAQIPACEKTEPKEETMDASTGGEEEREETASDEWGDYITTLPAVPEGVRPGQFCVEADRLVTIYAYTETSALQCQDANGYRWVETEEFADLVALPTTQSEGESSSDEQESDEHAAPVPGQDGRLPVTGGALAGIAAAGVLTATGGGVAMAIAGKRRANPREE